MESASCELELKPSLYNNRPIHSNYFRPGNTRLPGVHLQSRPGKHPLSVHWCLARGENHPHSTHLSLGRSQHPRRPQGFGSLPISRPGLRKLPTRQSMSSMWTPYCLILLKYPARAGIPLRLWGLTSTFRYESCRNRLTNHSIYNTDHLH